MSTIYRTDHNEITGIITLKCVISCIINLSNKTSLFFSFQRIEGWALVRDVGAYLRGAYLTILCIGLKLIRGGAYSRGRLIEALNSQTYYFCYPNVIKFCLCANLYLMHTNFYRCNGKLGVRDIRTSES